MDHYDDLKRLHTETERFYLILKEKEEIVDLLLQLHEQVDQYVQALGFQLPDYLKVPPEIYEAVKDPTPPPKPLNAGSEPPATYPVEEQQPEPQPEPTPQEEQPTPQPQEEQPQQPQPTSQPSSSGTSHYQKIPSISSSPRPTQRAASVSVVPSRSTPQAQPASSPTPPAQQSQYMAIPTKQKSFTIVDATEDVPPPPPEPELPVIPPEADPKWYFGSINRSEAEALLHQSGKNSLLVRNSSVPGCFALSIFFQENRKIAHILIQMNAAGGKILWSLENSIDANVYENFLDILLQSPECHNHVFAGLLVPNNHWSAETPTEQDPNQVQQEQEQEQDQQQTEQQEQAENDSQTDAPQETEEEKKLRFRKRVIEEIIQTEKDYTNDLGVLVKHYSSVLAKKESKVISQDDAQKLFSNLSEILDINYSVLNTLEQRKRKGSSGGQYIVGDAFLKIAEDFKPYTVYCINHPIALKTLEKLRASNSAFVQFEKKSSLIPETKGIGLVGFLIKPVQRICKYPILLKELLKYTPTTHVEYENLQEALDKIEQVVNYINERKRMAESNDRLTAIQNTIEGLDNFTLPKPTRELVMELNVKKVMKKNELSDYMLWVFNDLFLFAKAIKKDKYKYKGRVHLDALRVIDVIDSEDVKNAFEIEDRNKLDEEKLLMCCLHEKDKKFFMNETKKVIKDYYIQHHDQLQAEANARKYLAEFQFKETDLSKLKELQSKKPPAPVKLTSNQNLLAVLQQQQLEKALSESSSSESEQTPEPKNQFSHLNRQKSSSVSVVPSKRTVTPASSGSAPSSPSSNSFVGLSRTPSSDSESNPQKEAVTLVFNTGGSTGAVPQRATRRAPARPMSVRSPLQPVGSNEDLNSLNSSSEDLSKFAASSDDLKVLVHSTSTESIGSQPQSPSTSTDKLPNLPPPATTPQPAQAEPAPQTPASPKLSALPVKTARSSPIKRVSSQSSFQ